MINIPHVILTKFKSLKSDLMNQSPKTIEQVKTDDMTTYHHTLGYIRNLWFWHAEDEGYKFFKEYNVWHADDMSSVFLEAWQKWLNEEEFDFIEFLKDKKAMFDKHWEMFGLDPDTGKEIEN